ncbi:MAG: hypothetical protein D6771_08345 [Zetaproteobacteria bacterium]|nr:MAG: hypothetical protein D6771_08345 [Zetaproteobacteria bacterium]
MNARAFAEQAAKALRGRVGEKTYKAYVSLLRAFAEHFGDTPLDAVDEEALRRFFTHRGYSGKTREALVCALRRACKELGILHKPFFTRGVEKVDAPRSHYPNFLDERALTDLRALPETAYPGQSAFVRRRARASVLFVMDTLAAPREVIGALRKDLIGNGRVVMHQRPLGENIAVIKPDTEAAIEDMLAVAPASKYLFCSATGKPVSINHLSEAVRSVVAFYIPKHLHYAHGRSLGLIRASMARVLYQKGTTPTELLRMLGITKMPGSYGHLSELIGVKLRSVYA